MNAYALMVEYRIEEEARADYLALIGRLAEGGVPVSLYEGTDQPNLFVEIWPAASEEEARACQEERLSERSPWVGIGGMVAGGRSRIHAWTFKPSLGRRPLA
ncbi:MULTISPECIES: hypothetical protein [Paenibacillus]|uniref:hypothetical protein n=1 Tax=Paenibacillus TaxID=44249 RepID=UPI00061FA754|nr:MULTISPECIES: hypothetical protein [Paenibacillus]KKC47527.1 hypothetical protein VE23_10790 [Paenibacillus sp. D9]